MVIVDGSGSMWGNLGTDKRPKLELVRDALRALLPSLRPEARVGLASFGHRRRGNCGDAEVIVPPDAMQRRTPVRSCRQDECHGQGAARLALRESANAIAGATPASIVLIADDLDNCGQDICAVVGEIAAASPNLVVHTVALGFDKAEAGADQLHRAADRRQVVGRAGRGRVRLRARAGRQSRQSAKHTQRHRPDDRADKPAAEKPAPGAPSGLYLSAGLGETSATLDSPVHWRITKAGADGALVRDMRACRAVRETGAGHLRSRSAASACPGAPRSSWRPIRQCRCASI